MTLALILPFLTSFEQKHTKNRLTGLSGGSFLNNAPNWIYFELIYIKSLAIQELLLLSSSVYFYFLIEAIG